MTISCIESTTCLFPDSTRALSPFPATGNARNGAEEEKSPDRGSQWAILDSNQGPPPYQSGALTD